MAEYLCELRAKRRERLLLLRPFGVLLSRGIVRSAASSPTGVCSAAVGGLHRARGGGDGALVLLEERVAH